MTHKRIPINCFFMCYLMYILLVLCDEIANLIFFLLDFPQASIYTDVIAMFFFLVIAVFLIRNILSIQPFHYSPNVIFFSIVILIFGLLKAIYPDMGWDNGNYHLIAQNREFTNWFETGFAVGNFQIYGFRLGDRCYTLFRTLLGYRFGVLISLYAVECSYYLLVDLIDKHLYNFNSSAPHFKYSGFSAFIILFTHNVATLISSYYVDLLAIPLLLEMLRYVLVRKENTSKDHIYIALLAGLSFAFKMTNIVYIAPIIILYIFQNYRELHCKNILQCAILCIFPCSIYAIYNYVVTRNPVFPYYNFIFKSPYFHLENWSDKRWGGTTIAEKIFWIFYHTLRPDYRQGENVNVHSQLLMIALIFSICTFFILVGLKFAKKEAYPFTIYIIFFSSSLIWSFTTGYARYFIFGDILLLLMFFISFFEIYKLIPPPPHTFVIL